MTDASRYDGQPFLQILECYVLACIRELPEDLEASMKELEPDLRNIYDRDGTWLEIVEQEMGFPPKMPEVLLQAWLRSQKEKDKIPAQDFAEMFADQTMGSDDEDEED